MLPRKLWKSVKYMITYLTSYVKHSETLQHHWQDINCTDSQQCNLMYCSFLAVRINDSAGWKGLTGWESKGSKVRLIFMSLSRLLHHQASAYFRHRITTTITHCVTMQQIIMPHFTFTFYNVKDIFACLCWLHNVCLSGNMWHHKLLFTTTWTRILGSCGKILLQFVSM